MRIVGDNMARLWSKVDKREPAQCWPWTGGTFTPGGYPVIRIDNANRVAHRWLWEQMHNVILTAREEVDHTCRNIVCLNPAHHEAVTKVENRRRQAAAMRERVCDLPGCGMPHRARGLCSRHWWADYRRRVPRRS